MRRWLSAGLLIVALTAAVLDPIGFTNPANIWPWWLIQFILIVGLYLLVRRNSRRYFQKRIRPTKSRTIDDIGSVPEDEAYALQRLAGQLQLDYKQARILALAILQSAELRERVSERYTPSQRALTQEVAIEATIPGRLYDIGRTDPSQRASMDVFFPVLILPKGIFCDNLNVYGPDDERIAVLSYREYLQLAARLLRIFLYLAYDINSATEWQQVLEAASAKPLEQNVSHLEHRALCEIMKRAQANAEVKELLGISPISLEAKAIAAHIESLNVPPGRKVYLRLAADLLRMMSRHYALVAATRSDKDGRIFVRYTRTLIPELNLTDDELEAAGRTVVRVFGGLSNALRSGRSWLRILLGARPIGVTVSLDNAWTCQSYHVRVDAPEGLYLADQKLIASEKYLGHTEPPYMAKGAPTAVHYRFRRRLGQSYAHFYGRFFPTPLKDERRPKLRLEFYEVPPGSMFRAAVASAACLALVWVVGFVMSRKTDVGTDVPAWLLVFPGVAASWLGFDAPSGRFFEGTLAARLSLVLTTIISVAASALFVLNRSGLTLFAGSLPTEKELFSVKIGAAFSVLGLSKWAWAILIVLSLFNTIYMATRWLQSSWRFKHLAERTDPEEGSLG